MEAIKALEYIYAVTRKINLTAEEHDKIKQLALLIHKELSKLIPKEAGSGSAS